MLEYALINSLSNAILFTIGLIALYSRSLRIRDYCLFFTMLFSLIFVIIFFGLKPLIITWFVIPSIFLSHLTGKKKSAIVYFILYIIIGLAVLPMAALVNLLAHHPITNTDQSPIEMIIIIVLAAAIYFPIILGCKRVYRKYLAKIIERIDDKLFLYITFLMAFSAFFIFGIMTLSTNIAENRYYPLIVLVTIYIFLTVVSVVVILITTRKNYEQQQRIRDLSTLREYTDNLEATYNNLRSFKHDYVNILSTLSIFIDEKRYDELDVFFHDHIMPLTKELTQKNASLANLSRIKNLEIKSIFYSKLLLAINKNIEVTVDIPDEIGDPSIDSIDITRILGIYLDNAIEAAVETEHPFINIHSGKLDNGIVFIIANSYIDHGLSVSQMCKKGVSSKGNDRGIGLYNVSVILNKYDNIFTETSIEDGSFIQKIHICGMHQ
ncbi:two-component system, AgrA family, sensor histidine kinase AgrC [Butyrivibrio sp. ob235]|nr:two-component system, AgrA family, sensor histidine kinase AgrC [Butyrivibrio sp. ob235]